MVLGDITTLSSTLGIHPVLLAVFLIWSLVWKGLALWKSARKPSKIWFIVLLITNTVGILPILYIFIFSKMKLGKKQVKKTKSKQK